MNRRKFLESTLSIAAAGTALMSAAPAVRGGDGGAGIIDTNVSLGDWPFRKLPDAGPARLEEKLRNAGVTEAWAGSFDALFHRDFDAVNERLAEACRSRFFRPMGALNLAFRGWRETLRRLDEVHGMSGIRLHPNYHGYGLGDWPFRKVLVAARERGLLVQVALRMEDTRTQPPEAAVPDVDPGPLADAMSGAQGVRVQLINALRTIRDALSLQRLGGLGVRFEIAMLEGMEGVRNYLDRVPAARLAFGSHAPFFHVEAASLKLRESVLSPEEERALRSANATELIKTTA